MPMPPKPSSNPDHELIDAVKAMTAESTALRGEVARVAEFGKENRSLIRKVRRNFRAFVAGLTLDIGLSIAALVFGLTMNHVIQELREARNYIRISCEVANAENAKARALWESFFVLPPPPDQTPAQKKDSAEKTVIVKAKIADTYKDRDCN